MPQRFWSSSANLSNVQPVTRVKERPGFPMSSPVFPTFSTSRSGLEERRVWKGQSFTPGAGRVMAQNFRRGRVRDAARNPKLKFRIRDQPRRTRCHALRLCRIVCGNKLLDRVMQRSPLAWFRTIVARRGRRVHSRYRELVTAPRDVLTGENRSIHTNRDLGRDIAQNKAKFRNEHHGSPHRGIG
jgi:hypothetical protein